MTLSADWLTPTIMSALQPMDRAQEECEKERKGAPLRGYDPFCS